MKCAFYFTVSHRDKPAQSVRGPMWSVLVFAVACVFSLICCLPDVVSVRLFVFHAFESAGVLAKTKLMHAFGFQSAGLAQAKAYELPQTVPTFTAFGPNLYSRS